MLGEEMARKADPEQDETEAARHLDVDHRQRDRDAGAALEHLVEEAVAPIVVVVLVAAEAALDGEELDQPAHALGVGAGGGDDRLRLGRQRVERAHVAPDVEAWIRFGGDQQRRLGEIDGRIGPADQLGEARTRGSGRRHGEGHT